MSQSLCDESKAPGDQGKGENDGTRLLSKWALTFKDDELERAYLATQREVLRWTAIIGFAIVVIIDLYLHLFMVAKYGDWAVSGPLGLVMNIYVVSYGYSLVLIFILTTQRGKIGYKSIEVAVIIGSSLLSLGCVFSELYRAARIFGEDPEKYWDQEHFSDSGVLLSIDLIITATHLFLPIRSCVSWVIPITGVVNYTLVSYTVGSKDNFVFIHLELAALAFIAWYGRRRSEKESRLGFARHRDLADTVRIKEKEVIAERVKRFDAEHQNEQNIPSATRHPKDSKEHSDSLSFSLTTTTAQTPTTEVESGVQSDLASAPAGARCGTLPDKSTPSTKQCSAQSQTTIVENEDKATDPMLVWGAEGWKCQRCCKPPLAPAREIGMDGLNKIDPFVFHGSKKRRTGSSRSSSSVHSASEDAPPHISTFSLTPYTTQYANLMDLLETWNCARGGQDSCCPFHVAVKNALLVVKRMCRQQCNPLWSPYSGGQCRHCYSMVDARPDPDDYCDSCGMSFGSELLSL